MTEIINPTQIHSDALDYEDIITRINLGYDEDNEQNSSFSIFFLFYILSCINENVKIMNVLH